MNAKIWHEISAYNLENQASRVWERGWKENIKKVLRLRPAHIKVIWQITKMLFLNGMKRIRGI
jgi:hypothetical protein